MCVGAIGPVARTYLVELLRAEEGERAHQEVERAWEDLLQAMSKVGDSHLRPSVVTTSTLRAYMLLTQGRADKAVEVVRCARAWGESHPNFDLLLGNALLATCGPKPEPSILDEVETVLQEALSKQGACTWKRCCRGRHRMQRVRDGHGLSAARNGRTPCPV